MREPRRAAPRPLRASPLRASPLRASRGSRGYEQYVRHARAVASHAPARHWLALDSPGSHALPYGTGCAHAPATLQYNPCRHPLDDVHAIPTAPAAWHLLPALHGASSAQPVSSTVESQVAPTSSQALHVPALPTEAPLGIVRPTHASPA